MAVTDYQIQNSTLRCARSGRELQPGERFFSVLFDRDGMLVREDISQEAWNGSPAEAFSFWMSRVPPKDQKRLPIDGELLFDCFERLAEDTEPRKINFRYILALLLMRRKRLKFEEVRFADGLEFLVLRCGKARNQFQVLNPQLTEQELAEVQEEVGKVFGF